MCEGVGPSLVPTETEVTEAWVDRTWPVATRSRPSVSMCTCTWSPLVSGV